MRDEQPSAADVAMMVQEAEAEHFAGLRDRVRVGIDLMVKELSAKGVNPMVGIMLGSLTGVLNTWLDHANDEQVDAMLAKIESIIADWRHGEHVTS